MGLSCLSRLNHNKHTSIEPVKSHSIGGSVQSPVTLTVMVLDSRLDCAHLTSKHTIQSGFFQTALALYFVLLSSQTQTILGILSLDQQQKELQYSI